MQYWFKYLTQLNQTNQLSKPILNDTYEPNIYSNVKPDIELNFVPIFNPLLNQILNPLQKNNNNNMHDKTCSFWVQRLHYPAFRHFFLFYLKTSETQMIKLHHRDYNKPMKFEFCKKRRPECRTNFWYSWQGIHPWTLFSILHTTSHHYFSHCLICSNSRDGTTPHYHHFLILIICNTSIS